MENKANIEYISVDKLHPHDKNPRADVGDITELAESIKAKGIMQNLTVVPATGIYYGGYTVIIGHRRLAAAKLAGLTEVPCVVTEMTPKEQIATMLLENMQRRDLTVYEEAQGIQMMLDLGETVETIAEKTGFSGTTIRRRKNLLKLHPELFKKSEGRQVNITEYDKLFEIENADRRNKLLESLGTNNFNYLFESAKNAEKCEKNKRGLYEALNAAGVEKIENTNNFKFVNTIRSAKEFERAKETVPEGVKLYYNEGYTIWLYRDYTDEEQQERAESDARDAEEEKRNEAARKNAAELDDISDRAYELRESFILQFRDFKKHADTIMEFMLEAIMRQGWHRLDIDDYADLLGAEIEASDDEKSALEKVRGKIRENPAWGALIAAYIESEDDSDETYHNYYAEYRENEKLDWIYDMLVKLGYEMSDEEKAYRDGTHELYVREETE